VTYRLVATSRFDRRSRQFVRAHPELNARFARVLRDLETDPFQAHLRLHQLRGELAGLHAVSLTYSHRIVLTLQIREETITLLDVGSHDEVYR
jgi:mRNA-degrading endonuclease YafQ of YafQ-DinJ toxin-antitoxin module